MIYKENVFRCNYYVTRNEMCAKAAPIQQEQPAVQCAICFGTIKKPKTQSKTLTCAAQHMFHQRCIWNWLVRHSGPKATCPLCREPVDKYPASQCLHNEYVHYINALQKCLRDEYD